MPFFSLENLEQMLTENYLAFLLLGALLVVMLAYRDVHLPIAISFRLVFAMLLLATLSTCLERWAITSPELVNVRVGASVAGYILQPLVLYLELAIIMPWTAQMHNARWALITLPIALNTFIYALAPVTGDLVFYYDEHYWFCRGPLGGTVYPVTFFYLWLFILWSARLFQRDYRRTALILFFMATAAILTGVLEATNLAPGFSDEAYALGALLYYIQLISVHESRMRAELVQKDLELSQNKVRLLREQIRPHFVFNSLQIIKSLIRTDQEQAVLCLEDFSDYLQANLDAITSDKLVPFETELQHVEAYVSLALADKSRNIRVEYDIRERYFSVPPLSIEPLVENAIRHGVRDGGTVWLSTRAADGKAVIVVADDGVGFDASMARKEQAREGVGLANVRTRLATMCDGTLEIQSSEAGTTVTVCVPTGAAGSLRGNAAPSGVGSEAGVADKGGRP